MPRTVDGFTHHGADREGEPVRRLPEYLLDLCRELRRQETPPEQALWQLLRGRQLLGLKFRRQHVLGRYVADFYCHEVSLIVELDGVVHQEQRQNEYDEVRGRDLDGMGLRVLRFGNEEVRHGAEGVLARIAEAAKAASLPSRGIRPPSPPTPLPGGEGGKADGRGP
jgi:very-short-patch-repair endonuclease